MKLNCCINILSRGMEPAGWVDRKGFWRNWLTWLWKFSQFSCSAMSDSLRRHEPQHARPPCPSPIPRVYPNSCPLSWWCHPTISSSVIPLSSCSQSFPASGPFQMSQLFASGGQSIGVSASTSVLPMNTQDWSPLGWTDWISLQSRGLTRVFSNTTVQRHQFFFRKRILLHSAFFVVQLSHPYMTTGKTTALTWQTFVDEVLSLLFNMLSRLVITFLPRSKFSSVSVGWQGSGVPGKDECCSQSLKVICWQNVF